MRPRTVPTYNALWSLLAALALTLLTGCLTEPAPGRCYLIHYYADGSQVWECFNGQHEPVCHSEAECKALSGTTSQEVTP